MLKCLAYIEGVGFSSSPMEALSKSVSCFVFLFRALAQHLDYVLLQHGVVSVIGFTLVVHDRSSPSVIKGKSTCRLLFMSSPFFGSPLLRVTSLFHLYLADSYVSSVRPGPAPSL